MSTPETKAKAQIRKMIDRVAKELGIAYWMHVPGAGGYGSTPGLDYHLVWCGFFIGIEAKRFDGLGTTTGRQHVTIRDIRAGGGEAFLVDSELMLNTLEQYMRRLHAFYGSAAARRART